MPDKRKPKRKRGGQPGNTNARRHGFYAQQLTAEEFAGLWKAIRVDGVAPEVAVLRVRLAALRCEPGNLRLRQDAARVVARVHGAGLDDGHYVLFKRFIRLLVEALPVDETNRDRNQGTGVKIDETNRACTAAVTEQLTERIEAEDLLGSLLAALERIP